MKFQNWGCGGQGCYFWPNSRFIRKNSDTQNSQTTFKPNLTYIFLSTIAKWSIKVCVGTPCKYLVVIEKRDTLNFGYPGVICALPPMSIAAFNVTAVFQVYKQDCSIMGIHFESNFPVYAFALLWFCSAHGTIWPLVAWDRE